MKPLLKSCIPLKNRLCSFGYLQFANAGSCFNIWTTGYTRCLVIGNGVSSQNRASIIKNIYR